MTSISKTTTAAFVIGVAALTVVLVVSVVLREYRVSQLSDMSFHGPEITFGITDGKTKCSVSTVNLQAFLALHEATGILPDDYPRVMENTIRRNRYILLEDEQFQIMSRLCHDIGSPNLNVQINESKKEPPNQALYADETPYGLASLIPTVSIACLSIRVAFRG